MPKSKEVQDLNNRIVQLENRIRELERNLKIKGTADVAVSFGVGATTIARSALGSSPLGVALGAASTAGALVGAVALLDEESGE